MALRRPELSRCRLIAAAAGALLAGCSIIAGGDVPDLPVQPEVSGPDATSVTIVLPDAVYGTIPPSGPDAHTATEAQLESVETYALHLMAGSRFHLDSRVNLCRFTARDSCIILPESKAGA